MKRRLALLSVTLLVSLWSQIKPLEVPGTCSAQTLQDLSLPCSSDDPCPLFLELAGVAEAGPRLVVTGNIHTGSATVESVLLSSDDGGRTWTEPHKRIPASVLDQIQFLDVEAGWISGHTLTNVPRDAFFLLTTDGGQTWRKRPVTSETRTGAVEQFWFDSRTGGRLALDRVRAAENGLRYEIWESMTGGESWSIRQVDSRPLAIKRPPRTDSLRLTTDARTKSYRLERRDGEAWSAVAAFSVSAGECKPEPPAAAAEPSPPSVESREPEAPPPTLKKRK